jgi:nucleotide-binding universal stress UspA family protein
MGTQVITMYNKALIATDGSEYAKRAEARVIEFVKEGSVRQVVAFHSISHANLTSLQPALQYMPDDVYATILTEMDAEGQSILDETKAAFQAENIEIETRLIEDIDPVRYVSEVVECEGFDLVVVGRRGHHSKLSEVFLGTVPTRLLHITKCDVLVVS